MNRRAIALGAVLGYSVGSFTALGTTVLTEYRVNGREGLLDLVRTNKAAMALAIVALPSLFAYCLDPRS